jgi:hypothetical protein
VIHRTCTNRAPPGGRPNIDRHGPGCTARRIPISRPMIASSRCWPPGASGRASPRGPTSSIGSHVAQFRCDSAPTKPHTLTPDVTTPTDAGSRGTGHRQYFRSRVAAVYPVRVCTESTAPTPREAATSRKAGYRDHTFHQERDLLPPHWHRRRRDGAHFLRSRLPHTSDVGRSAKTCRPITTTATRQRLARDAAEKRAAPPASAARARFAHSTTQRAPA